MSGFTAISTITLIGVVHATLQLGLGSMLLLYHASLCKHVKKKTKKLISSYIIGVMSLTFILVAAASFLITAIFQGQMTTEALTIAALILLMLAILVWIFYYRHGRTTELWLPKVVARFIESRAKVTESNTEAFSLGLLASFAEMPFTLILVVVAGNSILGLPRGFQAIAVAYYTLITVIPLIVMRFSLQHGETVVSVQRWRVKNKMFIRILSGVMFAVLAGFLWAFEIMGEGV